MSSPVKKGVGIYLVTLVALALALVIFVVGLVDVSNTFMEFQGVFEESLFDDPLKLKGSFTRIITSMFYALSGILTVFFLASTASFWILGLRSRKMLLTNLGSYLVLLVLLTLSLRYVLFATTLPSGILAVFFSALLFTLALTARNYLLKKLQRKILYMQAIVSYCVYVATLLVTFLFINWQLSLTDEKQAVAALVVFLALFALVLPIPLLYYFQQELYNTKRSTKKQKSVQKTVKKRIKKR